MRPMHVCVPVLKRYDLLERLLTSLDRSDVQPVYVSVIDNGMNGPRMSLALDGVKVQVSVHTPQKPMGVAESWNWFIRNIPEDRLITNDDIEFAPGSLRAMSESPLDFVSCGFGFACFIIRDGCVAKTGEFDEAISPGYAYFEDRDYYNRMHLSKIEDAVVECGVTHGLSQTLAVFTHEERDEHNKKFVIAQENFITKWGALPADLRRQTA